MPTTNLGKKWVRHYQDGSNATEAFLVSHGSHETSKGFTTRVSPSNIHFYVFHNHTMYTVEIYQILNYQDQVRFDEDIVRCKRRIATSIMGAGSSCWNYYLAAWDRTNHDALVGHWQRGDHAHKDLLIMQPNTGSIGEWFSGGNSSMLEDLFEVLATNNLAYTTIHFLCCRAVEGTTQRPPPPSTRPLYGSSNPYWPGI